MEYLYAIEYFDADSSGSQWQTVLADSVQQAVSIFKTDNPHAKVYDVFVQHRDSCEVIDDEWR
jgi:hypothetical protein